MINTNQNRITNCCTVFLYIEILYHFILKKFLKTLFWFFHFDFFGAEILINCRYI